MTPPRLDEKIVVTNPDPTAAVQEALRLAVKTIDDKFVQVGAVITREINMINEKIADMKAAVILARDESLTKLEALFSGINDRFTGNKELVDQLGQANATALQAALENQKELLTQLKVTFDGTISGVNEKIDAVNEKIDRLTSRLDTGQANMEGGIAARALVREDTRDTRHTTRDTVTDSNNFYGVIFGFIGVVVAVAAIAVSIISGKH